MHNIGESPLSLWHNLEILVVNPIIRVSLVTLCESSFGTQA